MTAPMMPDAIITTQTTPILFFNEGKTSILEAMRTAFQDAIDGRGKLPDWLLELEGMSGRKYRTFINNFINYVNNPRYIEVGSWAGSTFCSAIYQNRLTAVSIDNWSQFGGPSNLFFHNVSRACSADTRISVINRDFRDVDFTALGRFNVYLFDGPHEAQDQYNGLAVALDSLDPEFLFIVDDWNWPQVRAGTMNAIADLGLVVVSAIDIRTTDDDTHPAVSMQNSDWHNGYYIAVLRKTAF